MKAPWWFCCGWWSPWCVLDTIAHRLHLTRWSSRICDRHDAAITGSTEDGVEAIAGVIQTQPQTWANTTASYAYRLQ